MTRFTIDEVPIPRALDDDPHAPDFLAMVRVRNAVEAEAYGTRETEVSAERLHLGWSDPHRPHRLVLARVDGRVVGRAVHETLRDDASTSWVEARVLREFRGCGIGTALAERVEAIARENGARQLIVYASSPPGDGERIPSPTGAGSVPAGNPEVRFLIARGYALEQVERASRLPLPRHVDESWSPLPAASAADWRELSAEYRVHVWEGPTPTDWLDDIALLATRMSTDAPQGGLDEPEDVWDAARILEFEERELQTGGQVRLTAAAEHIPSGHLVAFTELSIPADIDAPIDQGDTLVLREHRGHRLGMHVKLANLNAAVRRYPGHPSVTTWNAEENRHMLAVNEALGFEPMGYDGAWKRVLT